MLTMRTRLSASDAVAVDRATTVRMSPAGVSGASGVVTLGAGVDGGT